MSNVNLNMQTVSSDTKTDLLVTFEKGAEIRIPTIHQIEAVVIRETLKLVDGDKTRAAKLLGVGRATLYRRIKKYGGVA